MNKEIGWKWMNKYQMGVKNLPCHISTETQKLASFKKFNFGETFKWTDYSPLTLIFLFL